MDLFQLHALGMASWLGMHSIALFIAPSLTLTSLIKQTRDLTDLETYLATTISILSISLASINITHSGLLNRFLAQGSPNPADPNADPSSHTPTQKSLLFTNTLLTSLRSALYYVTTNRVTAFNAGPMLFETAVSVLLTAIGGGLLLFGTGAGSDVKGRSHALFDTPEHKKEVKDRHAAKKAS